MSYQRRCSNAHCRRLICDVADKAMLPDRLMCQHCHVTNVLRIRKPAKAETKAKQKRGKTTKPQEAVEALQGADSSKEGE